MANSGYIVRREFAAGEGKGKVLGYIRVAKPEPGEMIYHGKFKPATIVLALISSNNVEGFEAIGDVTSEMFTEGLETFPDPQAYMVRREVTAGPKGQVQTYLKVKEPQPAETYYHGTFKPVVLHLALDQRDNVNGYEPIGEVTSQVWNKGVETF